MFGLSASKIVLLILVVAAVIFATRLVRSLGRPKSADRTGGVAERSNGSTTFERCGRCGSYADPVTHRCAPSGGPGAERGPG